MSARLKRDQHEGFGKEIRDLIASKSTENKELAGIIISELNHLAERKALGQRNFKEDFLADKLHEIGYLTLYNSGFSARVYYTVIDSVIWMLHLDKNKRWTNLTDATKKVLQDRLTEIKTKAAEQRKRR